MQQTSDEEITAVSNQFLMASLLVLKHAFDSRWLKGNFAGMLSIGLRHGSGDLQQAFLMYYFNRVELTKEQVIKEIKKLPSNIKDSIMSTYEMLLEEGRKEGIAAERAKAEMLIEQERAKAEAEKLKSAAKMKKSGFDNTMIADILELPIDEIEKL